MLEIRPKDAIGLLVETVETAETVDTMRIAETVDTKETEDTIETEDLKKFQLNQS